MNELIELLILSITQTYLLKSIILYEPISLSMSISIIWIIDFNTLQLALELLVSNGVNQFLLYIVNGAP